MSLFDTQAQEKAIARTVALTFLGHPYYWGGDDPMTGFDCSGYVIEILKSVGLLPRNGDWTAQGLYNSFRARQVAVPEEGCLVFYGTDIVHIRHVEYCLDDTHSIGASGGGSTTKTQEVAIRQNAYIKIRPITSRSDIAAFVDPFK